MLLTSMKKINKIYIRKKYMIYFMNLKNLKQMSIRIKKKTKQ